MVAMELDVKPPPPPPQVACTDDQLIQLAEVQRVFARVEEQTVEIGGLLDEIIAVIDAVAAQVRELRRLRAEGLGVDLAGPLREVESAFGRVCAVARRVRTQRSSVVEIGRAGGGEAVDALAHALSLKLRLMSILH